MFVTSRTLIIIVQQTRVILSRMTSTESRQAGASFDRAFQNLFTLISEVVTVYRQKSVIDGSGTVDARLEEVPPHQVEENLKAYKECFDSTGSELHVDVVLELYAKERLFLHRGYQCDSWLKKPDSIFYYGLTSRASGVKTINLDCVSLMIDSLKRADTQFRTQANVFRIKFAYQLYTIFVAALNYARVAEGEVNVRGVTPEVEITADVAVMEELSNDILKDLPKPTAAASGPPNGAPAGLLAGLSGMFPGGLSDVVGSLLQTLPSITKTVTETVSRTTGTTISDGDQQMIDSAMQNITGYLGNPDGMKTLLSELSSGTDGISRFVERILAPGGASAAPAPAPPAVEAPPAPPAPPKPDGPALD